MDGYVLYVDECVVVEWGDLWGIWNVSSNDFGWVDYFRVCCWWGVYVCYYLMKWWSYDCCWCGGCWWKNCG